VNDSPLISVIVPVYNGGAQLDRCLEALLRSDFQPLEIILVDDASTDGTASKWQAQGVQVLRLSARSGPAAARNRGVGRAQGNIFLFVDADVVVRRDTLAEVATFFRNQPDAHAVFGSYDDEPDAKSFISQYKNLLHHFTHQQASAQAATFWAGCGAVRREAFAAVGGFDERRYVRPSIEDVELGYRLRRRGFQITLKRDLQVKHLKRWTIGSLWRSDIFGRALPWSRLIIENGEVLNDLNLRVAERICAAAVFLILLLSSFAYFLPSLLLAIPFGLLTVFVLNWRLFRFFHSRHGINFAIASFAMLFVYYFYSGVTLGMTYLIHLPQKLINGSLISPGGPMHSRNDV